MIHEQFIWTGENIDEARDFFTRNEIPHTDIENSDGTLNVTIGRLPDTMFGRGGGAWTVWTWDGEAVEVAPWSK